jgi:hypothetical protein
VTTLQKAQQALDLGCDIRMSYSVDIQSGGAWHVEAQEYSRITGEPHWLTLGFMNAEDRDEFEKYAAERGINKKPDRWKRT